MNPFAVGIDVPVSQMPAGMAFGTGSSSGGGYGVGNFLGDLGRGALGALEGFGGTSPESPGYGSPGSRTPYSDRTKDTIALLMMKAMDEFKDPESLIS